jgi:hypothetical protein
MQVTRLGQYCNRDVFIHCYYSEMLVNKHPQGALISYRLKFTESFRVLV